MTATTTNLQLTAFNTTVDASTQLIYDYIDAVSGSMVTQNLGKIDRFAGEVSGSIATLTTSASTVSERVNNKTKSAIIQIVPSSTALTALNTTFYFLIPSELDGMLLYRAQGMVNTAGNTGNTTVQVANETKYSGSATPSLSTPVTIISGCTIGTPGTIDTSYDNVSTDDKIKIYTTAISSTAPYGLQIILEYAYA